MPDRQTNFSSPVPSPQQDQTLDRALWHAVQYGDLPSVRRLVGMGADVEALNAQGMNALHLATYYGQIEAYKTLLAARQMTRLTQAVFTREQILAQGGEAVYKRNAA